MADIEMETSDLRVALTRGEKWAALRRSEVRGKSGPADSG